MAWRYMRGNKSTAIPQQLIFLDCEARQKPTGGDDKEHLQKLRLGVAIFIRYENGRRTRRKVKRFKHAKVFWNWVESFLSPKKSVWLVAHNLPYDLAVSRFFERVEAGDYDFDVGRFVPDPLKNTNDTNKKRDGFICFEDPPTVLSLRHRRGGTLVAVDTLNYWRMSLKSLGKGVGIEKGDFPGFDGPDDELFDYCENDARIIEESVCSLIEWWKRNNYGMFRFTSPSLAMAAYRHRFLDPKKILFHDEPGVKDLERDSYTGGETEVYRYGNVQSPVIQVDVTSLYPFVMRDNFFPGRLLDWSGRGRPQTPPAKYPRKAMIGRVRLATQSTYPLRYKGSTLHVSGDFTTTLAGPELYRAAQTGDIVEWESWAFYRLFDLFSEYVDHFWELRRKYQKDGDKMGSTFVKLLLNSLYGKFGQLSPPWEFNENVRPLKRWGRWSAHSHRSGDSQTYLALNNKVFQAADRHPAEKSFHAIASFVTAYAREHMRRLREIAGDGEYYYQATDSLCLSPIGFDRLQAAGQVAEGELGKLKCEWRSDNGVFLGNNWYSLDDKIVRGGRKKDAVAIDGSEWIETHFQGFNQLLESVENGGVVVKQIVKRRRQEFVRGVVLPSGRVRPYIFPMEKP